MLNYDLYLQDKRLVLWFEVHKAFIKKLEEMYSDVDMVAMAEQQIQRLKQIHKVQAYLTSFQMHVVNLQSWEEVALYVQYYYSLKDNIKNKITHISQLANLAEIMEL